MRRGVHGQPFPTFTMIPTTIVPYPRNAGAPLEYTTPPTCLIIMDRFPEDYYLHNLPLILLSGLDAENHNDIDPSRKAHNLLQEGGFRIRIDAPLIHGDVAKHLQDAFRDQDASNLSWHSQSLAARNGRLFKITSVGRVGQMSFL